MGQRLHAAAFPDEERYFWIQDNAASLAGYIGLGLILIYQLITWLMVGRDPHAGTIVPQYLPPDDLSPAGVREVARMGFDNRCFAAEVVGLAAKNFLRIEQDDAGKYTLVKTNNALAARKLTDSEAVSRSRAFSKQQPPAAFTGKSRNHQRRNRRS